MTDSSPADNTPNPTASADTAAAPAASPATDGTPAGDGHLHDVIIIGAGLSGIDCAYRILEKKSRLRLPGPRAQAARRRDLGSVPLSGRAVRQ